MFNNRDTGYNFWYILCIGDSLLMSDIKTLILNIWLNFFDENII